MLRFVAAAALLALALTMGEARAQSPANCPGAANVRTIRDLSYTVTTADNCWWLNFTAAGTIQVNLPTPSQYFGPTYQVTLLPLLTTSALALNVARDPQTGIQGVVNSVQSLQLSPGSAVELRIGVGPNWHAALFGSSVAGVAIFPSVSTDPIGSLQYRASTTALGGYAISGAFTTAGGTFDLASGAACFNLGPWAGDLAGAACTPPTLAVGAAARSIGTLGNGLTGTLPNPGLNSAAVTAAIGSPGGDIGGPSLSNVTVKGIQNFPVSATPPTSQSALVWNGSQYTPTILSPGVNQGTGDVLFGPGSGVQTTQIAPGAVTNQKLAAAAALSLKGNPLASPATGLVQDIPVSGGLIFNGAGSLVVADIGVATQITVALSPSGTACLSVSTTGQSIVTSGTCSGGAVLTADDGATALTADDAATQLTADGTSPVTPCSINVQYDLTDACNLFTVVFW